jgi:SPP1 family predicted phage head-tail adaptor
MQIGRLDRKITIESVTETRDGVGQPTETWSTFATVWATKKEMGGKEMMAANQTVAESAAIFTIRYLSGVTPKMRINYGGNIYDILSIAEKGRQNYLEITTKVRL